MSNTANRDLFEILGLFCICLVLFTWGLWSQEVIAFDSRFYLFAQEMWRNGASVFPTTYDKPYPDYPGTSTLLIYFVSRLFGVLNKFTAVLPSAIAASVTVVFTYLIGSLHNKRWGLYAVFFLLLTITFIKSARSISLDMYPAMVAACCFYIVYSSDLSEERMRLWALYPLLMLAFAFRGPIGVIMPTGVICVYYLQDRQFKKMLLAGIPAALVLTIGIWILLSFAAFIGGEAFIHDVLRMEIMGRINNHFLPPYYYFTASLLNYALAFPVAVVVSIGVIFYACTVRYPIKEARLLMRLLGWILVIMIGMSIPGDKKIRYILPMIPAAALLAAYPFVAPTSQYYYVLLRALFLRIFLFFPSLFAAALYFIPKYTSINFVDLHLPIDKLNWFLSALQTVSLLIYFRYAKQKDWRDTAALFIAVLSFAATYIVVAEPVELHMDRARDLVIEAEKYRSLHHASLVFYKEKPDGLPIKYLINMLRYEKPVFLTNERELIAYSRGAIFVTSMEYYNALPMHITNQFHVIARDNLGHIPVVIFTNR